MVDGGAVWLLTGHEPKDWVRNLAAGPRATLELGGWRAPVQGAVVDDLPTDAPLRAALAARYRGEDEGHEAWAAGALAVRLTPGG